MPFAHSDEGQPSFGRAILEGSQIREFVANRKRTIFTRVLVTEVFPDRVLIRWQAAQSGAGPAQQGHGRKPICARPRFRELAILALLCLVRSNSCFGSG